MGAYSKGAYSRGHTIISLAVGHIPVEILLLINHFSEATHTINRIFFKGSGKFSQIYDEFFFSAL